MSIQKEAVIVVCRGEEGEDRGAVEVHRRAVEHSGEREGGVEGLPEVGQNATIPRVHDLRPRAEGHET